MDNEKWISYQKKDNLYIAKVFHNKREYYIGAYKKKEDAIKARNIAYEDIVNGLTTKYKSRTNQFRRRVGSDVEWYQQYLSYPSYLNGPEYKFRYAILLSALRDICQPKESRKHIQSRKWILGKVNSVESFSFEEICELFRLNAAAVREKLLNIDEETKKRLQTVFE